MIGWIDTCTLARTKLRAKKIRLIVTVVVSALIFGLIIGGMSLIGALSKSLDDYAKQQFDGKYFVTTMSIDSEQANFRDPTRDPETIRESKRLQDIYIAERTAAAKRLGITYDPKQEVPATVADPYPDPNLPKDQQIMVNTASVGYLRYNEELYARKLTTALLPTKDTVRSISQEYHPTAVTEFTPLNLSGAQRMVDGKESFDPDKSQSTVANPMQYDQTDIAQLSYNQIDEAALGSFILPDSAPARQTNKTALPVVLPQDAAVKLFGEKLGLTPKPKDAAGLIAWTKDIRTKLNGQTYSLCYRNAASQEQIQQAINQRQEIAQHRGDVSYTMPQILYTLPSEDSCGAVGIEDKQSAAEKAAAAKLKEFERTTNPNYEEPEQVKLTFVVVGLTPESSPSTEFGLEGFVRSFFGTTIQPSALIPKQAYEALPTEFQYEDVLLREAKTREQSYWARMSQSFLLQFDDLANARQFIMTKGCDQMMAYMSGCPQDKPFVLMPFGTNYVAMSQAMDIVRPILFWLLVLVGSIAVFIIMAMMGRVMADSRRETAVFRAIGARRSDIVKVYILYALGVALRIMVVAVLLGAILVLVLEVLYATRATQYAEVMYGVFNGAASFHFIGWSPYIAIVIGVVVVVGLVGVIPPLIRNVRRNPINDMRDE